MPRLWSRRVGWSVGVSSWLCCLCLLLVIVCQRQRVWLVHHISCLEMISSAKDIPRQEKDHYIHRPFRQHFHHFILPLTSSRWELSTSAAAFRTQHEKLPVCSATRCSITNMLLYWSTFFTDICWDASSIGRPSLRQLIVRGTSPLTTEHVREALSPTFSCITDDWKELIFGGTAKQNICFGCGRKRGFKNGLLLLQIRKGLKQNTIWTLWKWGKKREAGM